MRVLLEGLPIRGQSLAIVVEHLLEGWTELGGDDLHLALGPSAELSVADGVTVHQIDLGRREALGRLWHQSVTIPRLARRLRADIVLGVLPTTTITPLPCPRALIAYDLRHEQRPEQFGTAARQLRHRSYDVGFRQADAILCISDRTRQDLLRSRPWLAERPVRVAHLGADHVDRWPARVDGPAYALAFGQYGNKNVDLVIDAWAQLHRRGAAMPLYVVGLGAVEREAARRRIAELGLAEVVTADEWLSDEQFQRRFASASLVVFPSDFEGFGMPSVEAMRLGIPVVITPEKALLEVADGHATVMDGWDAAALADAVVVARARTPADRDRAAAHAAGFTWRRTAEHTRAALAEVL